MKLVKTYLLVLILAVVISSCSVGDNSNEAEFPAAENTSAPTITTAAPSTPTAFPSATFTLSPSETPTVSVTETPTLVPSATSTETLGRKLETHIVFYLLLPEGKRKDACGDIKEIPIISKRMRTGDKIQDMQIALNMLFSVGMRFYGPYYNALWDTHFTIESLEYKASKDYVTLTFGGPFPFTQLSDCDKHGIRQQIWTTFFHYKFKEKTFKYYDKFLIDLLGGS